MSRRDHSLPGDLQGLKPAVRSGLVAYLSPDAFLHIETGLVAGQVLDSESSMSAQKLLDLHARSLWHICFKQLRNPARFPLGARISPVRPSKGATHPNMFSLWRCWLVVGTRSRLPRFPHPRLRRGCKLKPVSSSKTTVSLGPSSRSFF